jgi:carboxymethylenebutenolidase
MRLFRRFARWTLIATVVLVAAVAVSVPVDRLLRRGAVEALAPTAIDGPAGPLHVHVARPPQGDGPFPLVVMLHEFWGLDRATIGKAELLAADGFVVVAPDVMRGRTTRWLPSAIWQTYRTPDARVRADVDAVIAALAQDPDVDARRLAVTGFCFGGRMALRYALERPSVGVTGVFYGSVTDSAAALSRLGGAVVGVFGADDASIPLGEVAAFTRALEAARVPHDVRVFPEVGHAFVTDAAGIAADPAQAEAWQVLRDALRRWL